MTPLEEELEIIVIRGIVMRLKCFVPVKHLQNLNKRSPMQRCTIIKRILENGHDIYNFRHVIRRLRGHK